MTWRIPGGIPMLKRIGLLVVLLVALWSPLGHAEDVNEEWKLLFEEATGKVFINTAYFKSNWPDRFTSLYYSVDTWVFIETPKINIRQHWTIRTETATGQSEGKLLYNKVYEKGTDKVTTFEVPEEVAKWEYFKPQSFLSKLSLEIMKFDILRQEKQDKSGSYSLDGVFNRSTDPFGSKPSTNK
jgi:hypothetical protein